MSEKSWNKEWETFWKPLLMTNGKFDEEKIKNEIHDYDFIIEQLPKVYCEVTGGLLSKHFYQAETVISAFEDYVDLLIKSALADYKQESEAGDE